MRGECEDDTQLISLFMKTRRMKRKVNKDCSCSTFFNPVCGSDGVSYANPDCAVKCGNVQSFQEGECPELRGQERGRRSKPCLCTDIYLPVCASNGHTYKNANCALLCENIESFIVGDCSEACPQCAHDRSNRPVCDSNKIFYKNECFATNCFNALGDLRPAHRLAC